MSLRLQARKLACERDDRWLFRDLDLTLNAGEILRIEGPNGSGKTTLLKILSGQLGDYDGELSWCGQPMRQVRRDFLANLIYLGHAPGVKAALTPLENLAWYQALAGEARAGKSGHALRMAALDSIGLGGFEDIPAGQLSAGQQRRVALARLELIPRALWVLDEPFTAIDQNGVAALEARLITHVRRGGSVLVTTHHVMKASARLRSVRLGDD
ncbi:cytochrome c biogenesis heme-transporting ATPase CcmA [Halomonas halocynthiae]|uniref:cytochrome c biogenesis heme-transporting ATPase CcmA n=1 Tax=Halomonas halocynthiae TaxID=176290 RepID=UPI00040B6FAB|nr:cytochrome c biogenesis heme-transporting ATPase CcmA [Halomonas halocynthiae]